MRMEEFLAQTIMDAARGGDDEDVLEETSAEDNAEQPEPAELDVQKAVVEELAVDKAKLEEEVNSLKIQVAELTAKLAAEQERHFDEQSRNPNALALLDRDVELPDRFPGETRDHVIEAVREARDKAETEGRIRRAQLLEGVLVANESSGNLAKKRAALEKFFNDNGNILSGPVLEELSKYNIALKNGEEYLLPSEILKRMY